MFKNSISSLERILYNPLFIVLMTPLTYMLVGTVYALRFTHFHLLPFVSLYIFLLIHQFLKKRVTEVDVLSKDFLTSTWILLGLVSLFLLIYFIFYVSKLVGILLILYSILIHFHFYLKQMELPFLSNVLLSFFKGLILTFASFFIQIPFIPTGLFKWSIPLILINFLVESCEYDPLSIKNYPLSDKISFSTRLLLMLTIGLSYFIVLFGLFSTFQFYLLFFVLTIPALIKVVQVYYLHDHDQNTNLKKRQVHGFAIVYYLVFSLTAFSSLFF